MNHGTLSFLFPFVSIKTLFSLLPPSPLPPPPLPLSSPQIWFTLKPVRSFDICTGIGLNLILAPLAADMFYAVAILSGENAGAFGKGGAYAQAYSLFDAALGLATFCGPAGGGFFLEQTNWQELLLFFVRWVVCLFEDIRVVELVKGVGRERGRGEVFVEDYQTDDEYCTSIPPFLSIYWDVLEKT